MPYFDDAVLHWVSGRYFVVELEGQVVLRGVVVGLDAGHLEVESDEVCLGEGRLLLAGVS